MSTEATQIFTAQDVYLGIWTDWSYGRIRGATLTLNSQHGGLLAAFIALFVSFAGTSFFRFAYFVLHHIFSSNESQDTLYHQRQAILRNSANGTTGLWSLTCLLWIWRGSGSRIYSRLLPSIALTLIIVSAFAIAGIFSSRISSASGQYVLLSGFNCRRLQGWEDDHITPNFFTVFYPYFARTLIGDTNYAQQCYMENSAAMDCPRFIKPSLSSIIDRNATCPFGGDICKAKYSNIRIDTGFLDSHDDFGINSPPEDRVLYRSVQVCAPLKTEGHTGVNTMTQNATRVPMTTYRYGTLIPDLSTNNFTYQYPSNRPDNVVLNFTSALNADYTISSIYGAAYDEGDDAWSGFTPIDQLRVPDSEVTVAFLSPNGVIFSQQSKDLWYAANVPSDWRLGSLFGQRMVNYAFFPEEPVEVLACSRQQQWCKPGLPASKGCLPLSPVLEKNGRLRDQLWNTESQRNQLEWFNGIQARALDIADVSSLTRTLGVSCLSSRKSLVEGVQFDLPENQWQLEVEYWHKIHMATLQRLFVDTATGPSDERLKEFTIPPNTTEAQDMCRNQKVRSAEFTSFNVLGLVLTLSIGAVFIVTSYSIETACGMIQKRRNKGLYERMEWTTNGTLQLQRLAHEELGLGTWTRTVNEYPITERDQYLAVLDLDDTAHPKLKAVAPLKLKTAILSPSSKDAKPLNTNVEGAVNEISPISRSNTLATSPTVDGALTMTEKSRPLREDQVLVVKKTRSLTL
ncbi:hypothetical protein BT63DRAFT_231540 [Microthyrium microscopicum]|uniref:Uncharacterized protein n=1 Tax=Microthyrium microscopicum TaxID=703497 RepID=A0A6A6UFD2_9PEZI|nr:hypothetical protein BT63DRAFT_231540 [Microthyrium microscopicum]